MVRIIQIAVDLREAHRSLYHATVEFPVRPDSLATFTTPLWIQESHRANGPVAFVAGLRFSAGDQPLPWRRNPREASQYFVQIPPCIDTISASFDAVLSRDIARHRVMLRWEHVLLYPAGRDIRALRIQPTITIPASWGIATALENICPPTGHYTPDHCGFSLKYHPTSLERLADSPVLAGLHLSRLPITPNHRHMLVLAPDRLEFAKVSQELLSKLAKLVEQVGYAFGPRHYGRYWMLISLTDIWPGGGREHHDSFDVNLPLAALDSENPTALDENTPVISHEYVHSWCGKFRRPAGHVPHDFSTPLDGRLMWVYEGLTQYYGQVMAVRSGLMSREGFLADLAQQTAWLEGQAGRQWRSVEDTGTGCSLPMSKTPGWSNWMRFGDYYMEGLLVWLDVDTLIRAKTGGRRSLDDFARSFFGKKGPTVLPYTLEDIILELDMVVPYDWGSFFQTKIVDVTPRVNVDGIERAGYRLIYTREPGFAQDTDKATMDAIWNSIGVNVAEDGHLKDVRHGGLADIAKLGPTQTIVKVGGFEFSVKTLADEVAKNREGPIRLTVTQEDEMWEVKLKYDGGLRYPRLVRRYPGKKIDLISSILDERKAAQ